jgi:hypothetical protein
MPETEADAPMPAFEVPELPADQAAALARLADAALYAMQPADVALDHAFANIEATKGLFRGAAVPRRQRRGR